MLLLAKLVAIILYVLHKMCVCVFFATHILHLKGHQVTVDVSDLLILDNLEIMFIEVYHMLKPVELTNEFLVMMNIYCCL